jgi:hypothetical protein
MNRFLGVWRLLPELCKYDTGQPPAKATYSLTPSPLKPHIIEVGIDWTDLAGKDFTVGYQIELGSRKEEKLHGMDVEVLHELNEQGVLLSTVWKEDKVMMHSTRQVKEDGRLEVLMETPTETAVNRIFQIY